MKNIALFLFVLMVSCNSDKTSQVTNIEDYDKYIKSEDENKDLKQASKAVGFWGERIKADSSDIIALAKSAGAYSQLFSLEGDIDNLIKAETTLKKAVEKAAIGEAGYLRALAHNYISQHRFKEALSLLTKAEINGEKLKSTQKMLFDVHLELGNFDLAKLYLEKISNVSDFDYLIRVSKWSDHKGDLDSAINYMEKAMKIAESSNLSSTKQWVYTNIADYYGHAGRIEDSYNYYLKALELDANDAYSKKGIAWIVYSYENNPEEAMRILRAVAKENKSPDYHLLMAEIAEYQEDQTLMNSEMALYKEAIGNSHYGDMYNKYKVLILSDDQTTTEKSIAIAQKEVQNRPTPQSYDLLAWAYLKNGDTAEALSVVENHVINKTFEPEALYHIAEIYKAAGKEEKLKPIKEELMGAFYELGPLMKTKINNL